MDISISRFEASRGRVVAMVTSVALEFLPGARTLGDAQLAGANERNYLISTFVAFLRSPKGSIGFAIVGLIVFIALFAPLLTTHDPFRQQLSLTAAPPSREYLMGNDELGRDIFSRVLYGARLTLAIGLIPSLLSALIGVPLGLLAGYHTNWLSAFIMRTTDVVLAFPGLLIAITLAAVLGPGLVTVIGGITLFMIPVYVRLVYGQVIALREQEFVLAGYCIGANVPRLILRYIFPNIINAILVQTTVNIAAAVLQGSALSFLGLGPQPPAPEWGAMVSSGQKYLRSAPHIVLFPGIAILLMVLGFSLLGDALHDALDPKRKPVQ